MIKKIAVSTKALRHLEFDRLTVVPKDSCKSDQSQSDDEEMHDTIDVHLLTHLVGGSQRGAWMRRRLVHYMISKRRAGNLKRTL